jgi:hypothetical protein
MNRISNKAVVGIFGTLAVLGAVVATSSGLCLWGLVLVAFLVDEVSD